MTTSMFEAKDPCIHVLVEKNSSIVALVKKDPKLHAKEYYICKS